MSLKQTAVKPWKRSATGSFGRSAGLWGLLAIAVPIVSIAAVLVAHTIYEAGYMPEILVDPLSWILSYVPLFLMVVAVLSFGAAAIREIRYWHRKYGSRE